MNEGIKNNIKYLFRRYIGFDPSLRKVTLNEDFLDQKKLLRNTSIRIIFDVGANVGQTTRRYRKLFPRATIYAFEPFPSSLNIYKNHTCGDKRIKTYELALTDTVGEKIFYANDCHYTNSLLPVDTEHRGTENYNPTEKINVSTSTLDFICSDESIDNINILKMDIQGGELLALKGAENMLKARKIDLIYTEVAYQTTYINQPTLTDLEDYLKPFGYVLYKKYNTDFDKDNKPISGDAIFIKK